MKVRPSPYGWVQTLARFAFALLAIVACYRLSVQSARTGLSRLYSTMAIIASSIDSADNAVRLTADDPEAHYTRALTLVNLQRIDEAAEELREAVRLRPHHYYEWLDLGVTLDRLGDEKGAAAALNQSIRLAPMFAQPRWQFGNFLYAQGQYDEAFAQMRLASQSNPVLFETMLQLAWPAADEDVARFQSLMQARTPFEHLRLARFLVSHGRGDMGTKEVEAAGVPRLPSDLRVAREIIGQLLSSGRFSDASEAWSAIHQASSPPRGIFLNSNFTEPIAKDDVGFGWQLPAIANVSPAIDPNGPKPGTRSIRLEFKGETPPGADILSQLVLLQPHTKYSVSFVVRTTDLVTGGPPYLSVRGVGGSKSMVLGQSGPISSSLTTWTAYRAEFVTTDETAAAVFELKRLECNQGPCPIFGKLWLGDFSLAAE